MNRIPSLLVVVLLAAGLAPVASPQGSAAGPDQAPWWPDPDLPVGEFRQGWNLRIPLVVHGGPPEGTPVQVHLDLAQSLIEGGWPHGGGVPASFMAYPDAVRLVEYAGWDDDSPQEVPFTLHATWLQTDQQRYDKQQTGPFHGQRNPVVTLEWRLAQQLPPGQSHRYMAYFDIENNAGANQQHRKEAPDFNAEDVESLDGLYWVGAGTTVYGRYHHSTGQNTMMVVSTQPDTNVEVHTYKGRSTASLDERQGQPVPPSFNIAAAGQVQPYSFGFQATHFRVEADKPVVVMTHSLPPASTGVLNTPIPEFIPSREGGLLGWNFDVPEVATGVYIIRPPGGDDSRITMSGAPAVIPSGCVSNGNIVLRELEYPGDQGPRVSFCRVTFNTNNPPTTMRSITVDSGDPVMVQFIFSSGFSGGTAQAASTLGSPVGAAFHASTTSGMRCGDTNPTGGFQVTAWEETDLADVVRRTTPAPANIWSNVEVEPFPSAPTRLHGRGLQFQSCNSGSAVRDTNPYSVEVADGNHPIQVQTGGGSQATPFGGRHGMDFQLQGPFAVYNYYPTTRLDITHKDGSTETKTSGQAGVPREYDVGASAVTSLQADKPVSVFPLSEPGSYARFHSAMPHFLVPQILPGEYRGYLLETRSDDGTDPVFLTGLPGQELNVPFSVRNLGKWGGAPLADAAILSARVDTGSWDGQIGVDFDEKQMTLPDDLRQPNRLTLSLPDNVPSNTQLTVRVRAQSEGNAQMMQDFTVIVLVRQTFGVDMWFGSPTSISGPENHQIGIEEDSEEAVPFVIRNTGSNVDSFDVQVGSPGGGWDARITDALGSPLSRVTDLAPGEQVGGTLHVRSPEVAELASVSIPISAVSTTSPLASKLITLSADLVLEQGLELRASERSQSISPGETIRFDTTLHNTGEQGLSIRMQLDTDLPTGWAIRFAGLGHPSQPPISLGPGEEVEIPIDLTAAGDAVADTFVSFLLSAEAQGVGVDARAAMALSAVVDRTHLLEVASVPELRLQPGASTPLQVSVKNLGNTPDEVRIEPAAVPAGWRVTGLNESAIIDRDEEATLTVGLEPAADAEPGPVVLVLQATSGGSAFPFQVPVRVETVHGIAWRPVPPVLAQPGDAAQATLFLENLGNVEERVALQATGTWPVTLDADRVDVPAGSLRTVHVEWTIPADAEEGELEVTGRAESGASESIRIPVRVVAPRLEMDDLVQTTAPRGLGSVGTVMAMLHNPGEAPVRDAEVRLVSGQGVLDKVAFQSIGPNGTAVTPLRWTEDPQIRPERIEWGHWRAGEFQVLGTAPMPELKASPDDRNVPLTPLVALVALMAVALRRRGGAA